jgi:uncharacterized protein involved in high-affinity Fe2+ transport
MKASTVVSAILCAAVSACTAPHLPIVDTAQGRATRAVKPLAVASNESTIEQLQLARAQGDAVGRALDWLMHAAGGPSAAMNAGEYQVAYTLTAAEGWWELRGGKLEWRSPGGNGNVYLRVFVRDGADGRFVPGLNVKATVFDSSGNVMQELPLPFGWHPLLNAYGDNIALPRDGNYRIRIEIDPPRFRRHDPYTGDRFTQSTVAEFASAPVRLKDLARETPLSEAEEGQTDLVKLQADALARTLKAMWAQATSGGEQPAGDYRVAYAVEFSEAYWHYMGDKFTYRVSAEESAATNSHVEVAPLDARTGRFLPDLHVSATITTEEGAPVGTHEEPFMWHPWLYHYGENWRVPRSASNYRLRARFNTPAWRRYGRRTGRRFTAPVDIEFTGVAIESGEK